MSSHKRKEDSEWAVSTVYHKRGGPNSIDCQETLERCKMLLVKSDQLRANPFNAPGPDGSHEFWLEVRRPKPKKYGVNKIRHTVTYRLYWEKDSDSYAWFSTWIDVEDTSDKVCIEEVLDLAGDD